MHSNRVRSTLIRFFMQLHNHVNKTNQIPIKGPVYPNRMLCPLLTRAKKMTVYLDRIRADFESGKLKQGGKSFAEDLISNLMINAFPGIAIKRNVSPMAKDEFYIRQKQ